MKKVKIFLMLMSDEKYIKKKKKRMNSTVMFGIQSNKATIFGGRGANRT
jgi:hypothetical protein